MSQANKLDTLKKKFIFKNVGNLGRFGLAEREAYYYNMRFHLIHLKHY